MFQSKNNLSQARFGQILSFSSPFELLFFFPPWVTKFQDKGHATDIIEFDFYKAFDKILYNLKL